MWDADGTRYLDLLGGIAVNSLGHAHPTLTAAISAQLGTLGHVSNFFGSPTQIAFAERLLALAGAPEGSRVFLTNSGTEANEAAFKLARRNGGTDRPRILALEGSFHGRSMGALALTHKAAYREPFEPLPARRRVRAVRRHRGARGRVRGRRRRRSPRCSSSPIQGEAGVRPLPPGYLALARSADRRARRPADPRRGADRHGPDRLLVRPPAPARRRRHRARRGDRREGARRRLPRRRAHRVRRADRDAARPRPARHHVRREPGRVRRRRSRRSP